MTTEEFLSQVRNDKEAAFTWLNKTYSRKIYYFARRIVIDSQDAEDITQEVFLKIWNNISNFQGKAQLFTWIYRIITNESLNFLEKKNRVKGRFTNDYSEVLHSKVDEYFMLSPDEIEQKLQTAILELPPKQRLVFQLRYYEELPYEEISSITDISVSALKSSYHIATQKISAYFS